jgi:flavorubredoxin
MDSVVTEIAPDTYRISTFRPDYGIQFNQFLVRDDQPFLMHTGFRKMFPATLEAVRSLMDPSRLRWVGYSHFEPDECGALNEWLAIAPQAQPVCGQVGAMVMLDDYADRAARALADNEVVETGRHRLQFLATPHVPHSWDAGLYFDQTERTLLCSDLFFQPGNPEPITKSDIVEAAEKAIRANRHGPLAKDMPYTSDTDSTLRRLAALQPCTLAVMHGASYRGDGEQALLGLAAVLKKHLGQGEATIS